jgi:hypothetical protein
MLDAPKPPPPGRSTSRGRRGSEVLDDPTAARRARRREQARRARARERAGRIVPEMPDIGVEEVSLLITLRWLDEADATDRRKIGAAIAKMLAEAARG